MDIRTLILLLCIVDIFLGFICLYLSIQEKKDKKGKNKNGK